MSCKIVILILCAVAAQVAPRTILEDYQCPCDTDQAKEDNAHLLESLENNLKTAKEGELDYVLPAMISPLLDCSHCEEKNRKKRKILPDVEEREVKVEHEEVPVEHQEVTVEHDGHKEPKRRSFRNGCPYGYVRFGFFCRSVEEDK